MFTITVQNCVHQCGYVLDSIGAAIRVNVQRCRVFHAHVTQLQIFEQRNPHLSQVESHKQDYSDVPIKSNRSFEKSGDLSLSRDDQGTGPPRPIHRGLGVVNRGVQVSAHIDDELGWYPIMLKLHALWNGDRNILQFLTACAQPDNIRYQPITTFFFYFILLFSSYSVTCAHIFLKRKDFYSILYLLLKWVVGSLVVRESVSNTGRTGTVGDRLTNTFTKDFCVRITNTFKKDFLCLDNKYIFGGDLGDTPEITDEILTTARDLELEVNEDDIEELIMGHEDEQKNSKKF
ncbi:uncharacterized protein TNCV_200401 [Trichonephila clavipes]|nr:uncharacterized protein TNCV_200401 [Trichonephila clavipes]